MLNERVPNWAKIIAGFTLAMKVIVVKATLEPHTTQPTELHIRQRTTTHEVDIETQRELARANLRLVNLNR